MQKALEPRPAYLATSAVRGCDLKRQLYVDTRRRPMSQMRKPVIPSWTDERDTPTQSQRSGRQPTPLPVGSSLLD